MNEGERKLLCKYLCDMNNRINNLVDCMQSVGDALAYIDTELKTIKVRLALNESDVEAK